MQVPCTTTSCQQAGCSPRTFSSRAASSSGRNAQPLTGLSVCLSQPSLARRSSALAAQSTAVKVERPQEANRARLQQIFDAGAQLPLLSASPSQDWETLYRAVNFASQLSTAPPKSPANAGPGGSKDDDFYANVGNAIRTLRAEIPRLFQQDFTYDIYREDVVFRDPRNSFQGLKNYKTIFWSLRFHGRLFFKVLYVDVQRIWQPEDTQIRMRWTVHGVPRVPWDAEGIFDGISTFRLDRKGKIYEHQVDNVILRDPPMQRSPLFAGLNLTPLLQPMPPQPCPGAWGSVASADAAHVLQARDEDCKTAVPSAAGLVLGWQALLEQGRREGSAATLTVEQGSAAVWSPLQKAGGGALQSVRNVIANDLQWARSVGLLGSSVSSRGLSRILHQRPQRFSQPPFQT